jgi:hypothetical protein
MNAVGGGRAQARAGILDVTLISLPALLLVSISVWLCSGQLVYTLDDPYIHMALAKGIAGGHYGINWGESSAPSSSIIWPFLLALFSFDSGILSVAPLLINLVCCGLSGFLLLRIFESTGRWPALMIAMAMMLGFNVYGLVMTGMEHSLQALLVLCIVFCVLQIECQGDIGRGVMRLLLLSLVCLPAVRYEGMAITLPVCAYLWFKGWKVRSAMALIAASSVLVAFSLFLWWQGMGFLPSSVIAKNNANGLGGLVFNLTDNLGKYGWILVFLAMAFMLVRKETRLLVAALTFASVLHFLVGRNGWYGRYEVYHLMFVMPVLGYLVVKHVCRAWPALIFLPFAFWSLVMPTLQTPVASTNVQAQQVQMGALAEILDEPVAVNDLGQVALQSRRYVLDLWGLGSLAALKARKAADSMDSTWMQGMMDAKHVNYAFVYDAWFPRKPANWVKVGELKLKGRRITPAADTVALYATNMPAQNKLRAALRTLRARSLPPAAEVVIY